VSHSRAVLAMCVAALLWSIAGVVTRQLEAARGFEVTFWRSLFNAATLTLLLGVGRGPRRLWAAIRRGPRVFWISSACWAVMFTAFMLALTWTTVANVLVTLAAGPLFTALVARFTLHFRIPRRTLAAIAVAAVGILTMYASELLDAQARHLLGTAVALLVPMAGAVQWTVVQWSAVQGSAVQGGAARAPTSPPLDLLPAVLVGALLSAALTLPLALPLQASSHDLQLLALLGAVQLAVPCLLCVVAARSLSAPEASLLSLLEVVLGVAWVWVAGFERPSSSVLLGGALVLGALVGNELAALRGRRRPAA
jgi:drug/metabolite transporter (DMT)-like permease